jgi:hypothetical protein
VVVHHAYRPFSVAAARNFMRNGSGVAPRKISVLAIPELRLSLSTYALHVYGAALMYSIWHASFGRLSCAWLLERVSGNEFRRFRSSRQSDSLLTFRNGQALSSSFFLRTSLVSEAPYINFIAWVFMGRPSVRRNLMKIAIKLAMMVNAVVTLTIAKPSDSFARSDYFALSSISLLLQCIRYLYGECKISGLW